MEKAFWGGQKWPGTFQFSVSKDIFLTQFIVFKYV